MHGSGGASQNDIGIFRIIFGLFLLQLAVTVLFDIEPYVSSVVEWERALNAAVIGEASELDVKRMADGWFMTLVIDSGAYRASMEFAGMGGDSFAPERSDYFEDLLAVRFDNMWQVVWLAFYRMIGGGIWLIVVIPLCVALLVEAVYFREIRKWRYELTSPMRQEVSKKIALWFLVGAVYGIVAPIPVPGWLIAVVVIGFVLFQRGRVLYTEKRV